MPTLGESMISWIQAWLTESNSRGGDIKLETIGVGVGTNIIFDI